MQTLLRISLCLFALLAPVGGTSAQDFREDFLKTYRPQAAKIRDAYTNIQATCTVVWYSPAGKKTQISQTNLKYGFRTLLAEYGGTIKRPDGTVFIITPQVECYNQNYSFMLADAGDDGKRVMTKLAPASAQTHMKLSLLTVPFANPQPTGRSFLDLLEDPATEVIGVSAVEWKGKKVKELVLDLNYTHFQTRKREVSRYAFFFLTEPAYLCCGCRAFEEGRMVLEMEYEYADAEKNALPALKSTRFWIEDREKSGKLFLVNETTITEFKRSATPFPDADFTLKAFGFPEPENLPKAAEPAPPQPPDVLAPPPVAPASWSRWLWAGALMLLAIAVVFILRQRAAPKADGATGGKTP